MRDPHGRRTVVQLVDVPERVVPVGRLDADTTGALLLTNDGELAHRLAHPRYGVEKSTSPRSRASRGGRVARLEEGVELEDGAHGARRARAASPRRASS